MVIEVQDGTPEPLPVAPDVALVVDLDGTLTPSDTLHEGLVNLVKEQPFDALRLPVWLRGGKAQFKREVATRAPLDPSLLPYNQAVLDRVRAARASGQRTVLATAADRTVAHAIAEHLELFDEVIASEAGTNLSGERKRDALVERFGEAGFDYIANARVDRPIWSAARTAILANASASLTGELKKSRQPVEILSNRSGIIAPLINAARPYQWVKNILVFVPILAAQQFNGANVLQAVLAFLFFGLAASSVYLVNDIMDIEADRRHPRKRNRPFAAGRLGLMTGLITAVLLAAAAIVGAFFVGQSFALVLVGYLIVTSSYSLGIKRLPVVDIIVLAGLYTLRIVAGGAATETPLSLWLLAVSMFLFASLAFAKRYAEVTDAFKRGESNIDGRGYRAGDQNVLMALGTAAGVASIVTLALFVNNPTDPDLYSTPEFLWGVCPIILYWVAHIWLAAQRGVLTDDPIVFAFRDPASRLAFVAAIIPVALAVLL